MGARSEYFISLAREMIAFKYFDAFATILAVSVFAIVVFLALAARRSELDRTSRLPLED